MVPFQSMAIIYLPAVTSYLIAVQITFAMIMLIKSSEVVGSLKGDILTVAGLLLFPFIISYIWNYLFFVPVRTWETEGAFRGQLRTSLNMSNITQMLYVLFAYALFILFACVKLQIYKMKTILDVSIFAVVAIGAFQVVSWHMGSGAYAIYEELFYPLQLGLKDQTVGGSKRINSTFIEPSYFGFWASFTLFFYLSCFGIKTFIRSRAVQALFICGLMSTTSTFYVGAIFLLVVMYLFYSTAEEKMLIYIIGIVLAPFLIYFGYDSVLNYIESKQGSSNMRTAYGLDLAWDVFWTSPIFGKAYGTTKAFFIHTQMLASIGIFGLTVVLIALYMLAANRRNVMIYLLCVILLGLGNFEYTRPEMWVYLGLLSNNYITAQANYIQASLKG